MSCNYHSSESIGKWKDISELKPVPIEENAIAIAHIHDTLSETKNNSSWKFESKLEAPISKIKVIGIKKLECVWRSVYDITLDSKMNYQAGDAIGIISPNSEELVNDFMEKCNIKNEFVEIKRTGNEPFTFVGYIRDFIKHRFDFIALPKRIYLYNLAHDSPIGGYIYHLCDRKNNNDYMALKYNHSTILDIIVKYECKPSLENLFRNCNIIKPRYYSLINNKKDNMQICFGAVYEHIRNMKRLGHVSHFITNAYDSISNANSTSSVFLYRNNPLVLETVFRKTRLIENIACKRLVAFCTGVGIAPFLSIYNNKTEEQDLTLVYGYRYDEDDLSVYYNLSNCKIIRAKSSIGLHITDFIEEANYADHVLICGNMEMQKSVFFKIKEKFPYLIKERRIFLDSWS